MEGPTVNALEVCNLTIQYGNLPALKSVEFNVGNGRIVGIAVSYTHLTLPTKA